MVPGMPLRLTLADAIQVSRAVSHSRVVDVCGSSVSGSTSGVPEVVNNNSVLKGFESKIHSLVNFFGRGIDIKFLEPEKSMEGPIPLQ